MQERICYAAFMLGLFAAAFWIIFVAELGDKTLFMVLLLSARYSPVRVFIGAALAFLVHAAIAVVLGGLLAGLPHGVVRYGSAVLFLVFGVILLVRPTEDGPDSFLARAAARPLISSFVFIFVAEWGDMTQILSAALVADNAARLGRSHAAAAVFLGAVLGLWLGTALAATLGRSVGKRFPERVVRRIAGVCFLAVAAYTAFIQR